jgi:hypothetical protein
VRTALEFYGKNRVNNKDVIVNFGDCTLIPTTSFDFNNPEPQEVEYSLSMRIPSGGTGVFIYQEF